MPVTRLPETNAIWNAVRRLLRSPDVGVLLLLLLLLHFACSPVQLGVLQAG
jgi:hypothetical protein